MSIVLHSVSTEIAGFGHSERAIQILQCEIMQLYKWFNSHSLYFTCIDLLYGPYTTWIGYVGMWQINFETWNNFRFSTIKGDITPFWCVHCLHWKFNFNNQILTVSQRPFSDFVNNGHLLWLHLTPALVSYWKKSRSTQTTWEHWSEMSGGRTSKIKPGRSSLCQDKMGQRQLLHMMWGRHAAFRRLNRRLEIIMSTCSSKRHCQVRLTCFHLFTTPLWFAVTNQTSKALLITRMPPLLFCTKWSGWENTLILTGIGCYNKMRECFLNQLTGWNL